MEEINQECIDNVTDRIKRFLLLINEPRICYFCKQYYRVCSSLGQLECKHHPCNFDPIERIYKCCGGNRSSVGCVQCDHNEYGKFKQKYMLIPIYYYKHNHLKKVNIENLLDTQLSYGKHKNINSLKSYFKIKVTK